MKTGEVQSFGAEKMLDTRTLFIKVMQRLLKWKLIFNGSDEMSYRMEEEIGRTVPGTWTGSTVEEKTIRSGSTVNDLFEENAKLCAALEDQIQNLELRLETILRSDTPRTEKDSSGLSRSSTLLERRLEERNGNLSYLLQKLHIVMERISL
jgi:adenylosuccinate synthase